MTTQQIDSTRNILYRMMQHSAEMYELTKILSAKLAHSQYVEAVESITGYLNQTDWVVARLEDVLTKDRERKQEKGERYE